MNVNHLIQRGSHGWVVINRVCRLDALRGCRNKKGVMTGDVNECQSPDTKGKPWVGCY